MKTAVVRLGLRGLGRLRSQKIDYDGALHDGGEGRIFFHVIDLGVAFFFGFAQIKNGALDVAGLGKRLGEKEIEAPAVGHGAILKYGTGARGATLEELRVFGEGGAESGNGLVILALAEIGVAKI